jgi:hypothetical protein
LPSAKSAVNLAGMLVSAPTAVHSRPASGARAATVIAPSAAEELPSIWALGKSNSRSTVEGMSVTAAEM